MASCPRCGAIVQSPDKVLPVIVESPSGEHGVTQSQVGIFRCTKCDTMFPQVLTSRHYLFVPEAEYTRLGKELSTLREQTTNLEKAVDDHVKNEYALLEARQKAQLEGLESRARQLEAYVNYLRTEKRELEEETSR